MMVNLDIKMNLIPTEMTTDKIKPSIDLVRARHKTRWPPENPPGLRGLRTLFDGPGPWSTVARWKAQKSRAVYMSNVSSMVSSRQICRDCLLDVLYIVAHVVSK
jgi:hypothetical protein